MKMIVGTKFRLKLTLFEFLDQINNKKGIYELKKKKITIEFYIFKVKVHLLVWDNFWQLKAL